MHENRSNSQKGKRFMYNPLTNITIVAKENEINKYIQAGYKFGRKLKRQTTKGYIWIYNETTNKRLRINPNQFDEYKKIGYTFLPKEYWWNNGKDEVKSINQPGLNYIRGRLPGLNTKRFFGNCDIQIKKKISSTRIPIINPNTGDEKYVLECYLDMYVKIGYKRKFNKRKIKQK